MIRPVRFPHDPSRSAWLREAVAPVAAISLIVVAGSIGTPEVAAQSGQSAGVVGASRIGVADPTMVSPAGPTPTTAVATVRFGLSGAVNVLIATPGARLDPAVLGATGARWDLGHRWLEAGLIGPAPAPREDPVAAPAAPAASVPRGPVPPPAARPGPRLIGVPARQVEDEIESSPLDASAVAAMTPGAAVNGPVGTAPSSFSVAETLFAIGAPSSPIIAPAEPGIWKLENARGSAVTVVTLVSASRVRGGRLNGYEIGGYPTAGSGRTDIYAPPTGFIEVTPANRDLAVSQHLTVGQFLTKDQFDVWPKYVALDMRLIDKIELIVQELNAMGVRANRVHVMSGFRTPQYNGPGGDGRAALSRHMWGDAADLWIDDDGDGMMDDLNGDGEVNYTDASLIMRAVDRVEAKYPALVGGAGLYAGSDVRGPYIHVDARGSHARW